MEFQDVCAHVKWKVQKGIGMFEWKNETMANFKVFRTCSYCVFYFSVLSVVSFSNKTSKFVQKLTKNKTAKQLIVHIHVDD